MSRFATLSTMKFATALSPLMEDQEDLEAPEDSEEMLVEQDPLLVEQDPPQLRQDM